MDEIVTFADGKQYKKEKKNTFAFDILTLVGGTFLAQIFVIISAPILTRLYCPEDFGMWALYISITNIIGVISCMRYDYSIMLPESDKDAVNLLGLCVLATLIMSSLTLPVIFYFKQPIINVLNSPQIGDYLWLVTPFVFVNGIFLALNNWNSRTKLFKRLSVARVSNSISTTGTQISFALNNSNAGGLIEGSVVGLSAATLVLGGQIWRDDKNLIKENVTWKKIFEGLRRYRKFPLIDSWSALMNTISWQLPSFLLAAFFSPAIVGFYSLGFRLLELPMNFIGSSISQVFFQRASRAKSDGTLEPLVENVFRLLVIIGMFPILILTIVGSDIFTVVFGEAWAEAGVYAQILSIWTFVWFISSPLSTIYVVMEKQQFGFQYNFFNLATRLISLYIGGILGSARIALILFAVSGIMVYGYLCLKMLYYSGVKTLRALEIIYSSFLLFVPAGIILIILKIIEVNEIILVLSAGILICVYYMYILKTDVQVNKIINQYGSAK